MRVNYVPPPYPSSHLEKTKWICIISCSSRVKRKEISISTVSTASTHLIVFGCMSRRESTTPPFYVLPATRFCFLNQLRKLSGRAPADVLLHHEAAGSVWYCWVHLWESYTSSGLRTKERGLWMFTGFFIPQSLHHERKNPTCTPSGTDQRSSPPSSPQFPSPQQALPMNHSQSHVWSRSELIITGHF